MAFRHSTGIEVSDDNHNRAKWLYKVTSPICPSNLQESGWVSDVAVCLQMAHNRGFMLGKTESVEYDICQQYKKLDQDGTVQLKRLIRKSKTSLKNIYGDRVLTLWLVTSLLVVGPVMVYIASRFTN